MHGVLSMHTQDLRFRMILRGVTSKILGIRRCNGLSWAVAVQQLWSVPVNFSASVSYVGFRVVIVSSVDELHISRKGYR